MAFPTSPVEGQIYKDKVFSVDRWVKKDTYDFGNNTIMGTLRKLPFVDSTTQYYFQTSLSQSARFTYDCSTMVPVGTKAVTIKAMLHSTPSSVSAYTYVILGFSESNSSVTTYLKNNPQVSLIGDAYSSVDGQGYVGNGGEEIVVRLDNNRKFYSYVDTYLGSRTSTAYISLTGYYI